MISMGLESGDDQILTKINKGVDAATQIEQGRRVINAGMKLSCTVLLGLGEKSGSLSHAVKTGEALSAIDPNYVGALSLMLVEGTALYQQIQRGTFEVMTPHEILFELKTMMEYTTLSSGIFSANHASNYLPVQARFPGTKQEVIKQIEDALKNDVDLIPDELRRL